MNKNIGLFEGTAKYYYKYRSHYPTEIYVDLINRFKLSDKSKVLDLGCGPGIITFPLSALGLSVISVDPDVEMLLEGLKIQEQLGLTGILWGIGDDSNLDTFNVPDVCICLMGASFHWTNREELLKKLDNIIENQGGVVVLSSGVTEWTDEAEDWNKVVTDVVQRYLGPKRRAGIGTYSHPTKRHEQVIAESVFSSIEVLEYSKTITRSIDDIIGLTLSKSYSSPAQLGDKVDQFKMELKNELLKVNPTGEFKNDERYEVIVATRPDGI